jgi:hypothetical protein
VRRKIYFEKEEEDKWEEEKEREKQGKELFPQDCTSLPSSPIHTEEEE